MNIKHIFTIAGLGLIKALPAKAVCPVCVVAVGAGLGLSQYLGIDDTIAGTWIGGMLVAISTWTIDFFEKRRWLNGLRSLRNILIFFAYYALVIWPLYRQGLLSAPNNTLFGADKLSLGIAVGSIFFAAAVSTYEKMKRDNGGKAHFPFEKVALPVGTLAVLSLVFFIITR